MSLRERSGARKDIRAYSGEIPVTLRQKPRAPAAKPVALETRWRAASPGLRATIHRLTQVLQAREEKEGSRKRARKVADQEKFERAVEAICCNFAAVAMVDPARDLAVRFGNYASSYSPVYGKHFNRVVELMEVHGLVVKTIGHRIERTRQQAPSTIRPTSKYWKIMRTAGGWDDLHLDEAHELVVIGVDDRGRKEKAPARWLKVIESEVARINAHLRSVPLRYEGNEAITLVDMTNRPTVSLLTPHHRTVRRVFNGSIERGGRLYDGYWETMPRGDRFKLLTMNGELVNVDYGQLFLRLTYALAKRKPPVGDLYDLAGRDHKRADWLALREGRKRIVNALIAMKGQLKQWPGQTTAERAEIRGCFPAGTKPSEVVAAIKERHRAIAAEWFEQGRGLELHRRESDILIAVMLRLIDLGISALPMHDSVIVARSDARAARRVMLEEALRMTGAVIPVNIDAG